MSDTAITHPTLAGALWPATRGNRLLRAALLAVLGSALLAISARVQVPFWPVPMTLQTGVVLLLGAALGGRLAVATVLLYLAEGALGLPVFAGGGGPAYLAGPTGGYLAGFLVAAAAVGSLVERGWSRSLASSALAMILGDVLIFACGLAWLSSLIGLDKAIAAGLLPFLAGEALKIALAAALLPAAWKLLARR
ncbi:biotin transport system substrate-specific component [Tistlia consotensis]|uniref:Biotin transporter n=1 Tax=Tistlia consotensis USBA 355 TaxID=560819 RepID=A0A1Y6CIY0_9PROT|nr:biotin transporter BioY [Tistlia consotensis]SMF56690.1 biotin transport system substrate-specific component [Tistlia consotensis USBA 355]SNR44919.1 biotin transport system substrate-specific component [Tistlia consotensis]